MLSIKLFRLPFCFFRFNRNTKTLCFGITVEVKQPKLTFCFGQCRNQFRFQFQLFRIETSFEGHPTSKNWQIVLDGAKNKNLSKPKKTTFERPLLSAVLQLWDWRAFCPPSLSRRQSARRAGTEHSSTAYQVITKIHCILKGTVTTKIV